MKTNTLFCILFSLVSGLAISMDAADYDNLVRDVDGCEQTYWNLNPQSNATQKKAALKSMHDSCAKAAKEIRLQRDKYESDQKFNDFVHEHKVVEYGFDVQEFFAYSQQCQHLSGEFDSTLPKQEKAEIRKSINIYCKAAEIMGRQVSNSHVNKKEVLDFIKENLVTP